MIDLLRKTVRPEFREAISVLASVASKRNFVRPLFGGVLQYRRRKAKATFPTFTGVR